MYVQGSFQCVRIQWADVESAGRSDAFISGTVIKNGDTVGFDQVKYLVVQEKCFFYRLQFDEGTLKSQDLRCLLAAKGIYGREDLKRFCLKLLTQDELLNLEIPLTVAAALSQKNTVPGFNAGIYQDFVSQKYILTFAGTDDFDDIIEDIWQGLGNDLVQYKQTMWIADELSKVDKVKNDIIITGHSLGGGLASVASVVSGKHGITFNAAGLHKETLYKRNANGSVMYVNNVPVELYPGSAWRFDNAAMLIDAYYMDYDLLSSVQDWTPLYNALGNRILLDSQYDMDVTVGRAAVVAGYMTGQPLVSILGSALSINAVLECHKCGALLYGFLVKEGWNGAILENLYGPF